MSLHLCEGFPLLSILEPQEWKHYWQDIKKQVFSRVASERENGCKLYKTNLDKI